MAIAQVMIFEMQMNSHNYIYEKEDDCKAKIEKG